MSIFIIGYMGSGKSTVGKALASKMNLLFIDLDNFIEKNESKSISSIFSTHGELYFRKLERSYLTKLIEGKENYVISLGGGTPCYFDTINQLIESQHSVVFCQASITTLTDRLFKEKAHRPMISHIESREFLQEFVGKHLFERNPFYQKANFKVIVDELSIDEIVDQIFSILN